MVMAGLMALPGTAAAQMVGIGPRFSFVRGDVATSTPTNRFLGGTVRLKVSANLSVEGAADYRTTWNTARTERVREVPLQGSVLLYPIRTVLAPYLVGGMGIYSRSYDSVTTGGVVTPISQERKVGVHLGLGGDVQLGKRLVAYVDYRYRFVTFGSDSQTTSGGTGTAPVPGLGPLGVAHQGSMWTTGVAFVF
jgi:hypothetical protein